jgi:hypothetical protein
MGLGKGIVPMLPVWIHHVSRKLCKGFVLFNAYVGYPTQNNLMASIYHVRRWYPTPYSRVLICPLDMQSFDHYLATFPRLVFRGRADDQERSLPFNCVSPFEDLRPTIGHNLTITAPDDQK